MAAQIHSAQWNIQTSLTQCVPWHCYCSCEGGEVNWSISFPTTTDSEWQGKYSTDLVSPLISWQAVRFGQSSPLQNCSFRALGWKWRSQLSPQERTNPRRDLMFLFFPWACWGLGVFKYFSNSAEDNSDQSMRITIEYCISLFNIFGVLSGKQCNLKLKW